MASFEAIRDRLPSLYRPEDDDLADPRLPLVAADVDSVVCDPPASARLVTQDRRVLITVPDQTRVQGVTLKPSAAVSPTTIVAAFLPEGLRPHAIARVVDGTAEFPVSIDRSTFTIELRRRGLLSSFLLGIGDALDGADRDAALVMHAHWSTFADRALYSPFYLRRRRLGGQPPPDLHDPDLLRFPYVNDLARLGALLPVPPWPGELVEAYRLRIERMVALYKDGLGTMEALQRILEIELPVDLTGPPETRDRGFLLDEFAPLRTDALDVSVPGNPPGTVAPLMHWTLDAGGLDPVPATVQLTGVAPGAERPALEHFESRLALGYRGTVADGAVLTLAPAFSSWIATAGGVARAVSPDPTAPGPWTATAEAPAKVVALAQSVDRVLWAATEDGVLARWDGTTWTTAASGLGKPHCLACTDEAVLIGTDAGLLRVALFETPFVTRGVVGVTGPVFAIVVSDDGLTLGTGDGVVRVGGATALRGVKVFAIARDAVGATLYGTDHGLIQHQAALDDWYAFVGGEASDTAEDWVPIDPAHPPASTFPAVRAVLRAPDGALWIGTATGLARYVARVAERLAFTTALEAFPEYEPGAVHALATDARGQVWIAGEHGLLRADRRDLWHFEGSAWRQLGRADTRYDEADPAPRGSWRFKAGKWERFDEARGWVAFDGPSRITAQDAVRALAWSDEVAADIDGEPVDAADLVARYKPDAFTIVDGGVPAVPRVPPGHSTWRYLQLEAESEPEPPGRPTWTREGRRIAGGPEAPRGLDDPPEPDRFSVQHWALGLVAFPTAAKVRMQWSPTQLLSVTARLEPRVEDEAIEPAVLDRVFDGIHQVRPAGVRAALAVDETIVRGEDVGAVA